MAGTHMQESCNALAEVHARAMLNCCRRAYKPFVDEGYLSFVYGGGEEGRYLCNNPAVDSIHLTGSETTYNAIVWGPGNPKVGSYAPCCSSLLHICSGTASANGTKFSGMKVFQNLHLDVRFQNKFKHQSRLQSLTPAMLSITQLSRMRACCLVTNNCKWQSCQQC